MEGDKKEMREHLPDVGKRVVSPSSVPSSTGEPVEGRSGENAVDEPRVSVGPVKSENGVCNGTKTSIKHIKI